MVIQGNESSNCCKLTGKCQCITFHRSLRLVSGHRTLVFSLHRIWFPFNSFKPKMCHEQVNLFFLISFGCAKLDRMWTNLGVFARRNSIFMKSRLRWFWCSFLSICTYSISVSILCHFTDLSPSSVTLAASRTCLTDRIWIIASTQKHRKKIIFPGYPMKSNKYYYTTGYFVPSNT